MCTTCSCGLADTPPLIPYQNDPQRQPNRQRLELAADLLAHNDHHAAALRQRFKTAGVRALNLLSSPGSGKTALLEALARITPRTETMAVIVGDLATDNDARRLVAAGVDAVQITTGQACHLEAAMVEPALDRLTLPLKQLALLVIENVGNLVCPAAYDLGEDLRVVLLSVTEGEDKPFKYSAMFSSADVVAITKIDLAEAVGFDRRAALAALARVAPRATVIEVSARTGEGIERLRALCTQKRSRDPAA